MKRAFSLTELLVVVAIVAMLAALLFPVVARAKAEGKMTSCASNLHQLYLALDLYSEGDWTHPAPSIDLVKPASGSGVFKCPEHEPYRWPQGYRTRLTNFSGDTGYVDFPISYAYLRDFEPADKDAFWARILAYPSIGVLACPFHGAIHAASESPVWHDLSPREGPINRVCLDGHLIRSPRREPGVIATADLFYRPLNMANVLFKP